jgi:hypothetical protein
VIVQSLTTLIVNELVIARGCPVPGSIYGMLVEVVIVYKPMSAGKVAAIVHFCVATFQVSHDGCAQFIPFFWKVEE